MKKILIVDDELNMLLVLEAMLKKEHYEVATASDGLEALEVLKHDDVAVVVTDLKMPKLDGLGLLSKIENDYPSIPVIVITAHGTITTAVEALKKGAFDYITKPFDQDDLKNVISKAFKTRALNENEPALSSDEIERHDIIGSSECMVEMYDLIGKVAPTATTVLITGETGTGKELFANAIHRNSPRKDNPFIKINCAAIAENLLESEFFGFEKGAFTGAVYRKPGRFELAHTGTLFLDEIGDLPKDMQVKILRVIQDQEFERVGGLRTIKVDVRLIAATNKTLLEEVEEGRFREDLYYRLNVFPIDIPPLRERRGDIGPLADFFLKKFNKKLNRRVEGIDPEVEDFFSHYGWPGNIRELENLMERLVLLATGDIITIEDIPADIRFSTATESSDSTAESTKSFKTILKDKTEQLEKDMIVRVLKECSGNVSKAALQLGLSRRGLQLKMAKYNLKRHDF
ncbi:MAG TPA: sigma-54 dependent transcriptional regulator [Syntrophales bacterium]|nr:sigma-54 dependent transcriptional regulator [Syntrophales bacterium]HPQ42716.1 sigma-54 dependent transcriptional regulator [Syntrophales bacterium]